MLRADHISSAKRLGLDVPVINAHIQRLKQWIKSGRVGTWPAADSCRVENGGVLPLSVWQAAVSNKRSPDQKSFVGFVPAAGASSRYYQPIEDLMEYLRQRLAGNEPAIPAITDLSQWPIPESLRSALSGMRQGQAPSDESVKAITTALSLPKGLQHCTLDGLSFVEAKAIEAAQLESIESQCLIVPTTHLGRFRSLVKDLSPQKKHVVMDQGPALCTIRTDESGNPILDGHGELSVVPAGHGALLSLLNRQTLETQSRSAFIRNVDNVIGIQTEAIDQCKKFMSFHNAALEIMDDIRSHLKANDVDRAQVSARALLDSLSIATSGNRSALAEVQFKVFHTPHAMVDHAVSAQNAKAWLDLYARPLSVMGMVANTGKDVGGTPMFVHFNDKMVKICLELPHASEHDRKHFFENPAKATHFNPVFCAFELPEKPIDLEVFGKDFWIVAQKKFEGRSVLYHESILYELISNSLTTNCVFVEIPRMLFNPHKDIRDASGKSRQDWGFGH